MSKQAYIYGLVDPRTNEIRYIGVTNNPKVRYNGHCTVSKTNQNLRSSWIRELREIKLRPIMEVIEECDWIRRYERESEVIKEYIKNGANLLQDVNVDSKSTRAIQFVLTDELHEALNAYVKAKKRNASQVIREIICGFLAENGISVECRAVKRGGSRQ